MERTIFRCSFVVFGLISVLVVFAASLSPLALLCRWKVSPGWGSGISFLPSPNRRQSIHSLLLSCWKQLFSQFQRNGERHFVSQRRTAFLSSSRFGLGFLSVPRFRLGSSTFIISWSVFACCFTFDSLEKVGSTSGEIFLLDGSFFTRRRARQFCSLLLEKWGEQHHSATSLKILHPLSG
jgi:hypothetical protein